MLQCVHNYANPTVSLSFNGRISKGCASWDATHFYVFACTCACLWVTVKKKLF